MPAESTAPPSATPTGATDGPDDRSTLQGLDALDQPLTPAGAAVRRLWTATWPKLVALGLLLGVWQLVVASGWRPPYAFPGPGETFADLVEGIRDGRLVAATATTMQRAVAGYAAALAIGTVVGVLVSTSRLLRLAVGSAISAIQTMPSIAWFPLAILVFGLTEQAIFFVIVLGAAPSIAMGFIHGVDHIPPLLLRAGRALGARGLAQIRHVVIPAAMPGYVGGLKQGWAFAWRSLMAGELLVIIANRPSLGVQLQFAREVSDASGLLASMVVILVLGMLIDGLVFTRLEQSVRHRRGLTA